jgi:hypothetical protein
MSENTLFGTSGAPTDDNDPVMKALREMKLSGGKRDGLPEGNGLYEYEKLAWTRSEFNNAERLSIRLKCVEHDKPEHVGRTFVKHVYYQATGKIPFSMVMSEFTKYLLYPFGAGAKQAADAKAPQILTLLKTSYDSRFAKVVESQALDGAGSYAGKRIKINVVKKAIKRLDRKTQQVVDAFAYNDFPDVA